MNKELAISRDWQNNNNKNFKTPFYAFEMLRQCNMLVNVLREATVSNLENLK